MGSALDSASLIMYPSGYSDGVLGSAKPTDGSGDFTFTRGSNLSTTRVGPNGYIEKGYENLLLQSNSFLTTWTATLGMTLTPNQLGYDGSNDAWLVEKNANSYRRLTQSVSTSGVFTQSVYAKAGTLDTIYLRNSTSGRTEFDLTNGVIGAVDQSIYSKIEPVGNGWYRCSATFSASISNVEIYIDWGEVEAGGVYLQDAMLNQGLVAYPYIETTTAPVAGGILEDEPRIDFSDGCGHLLLEPSRTNLITDSEWIGSWSLSNISVSIDDTISPEGYANVSKLTAPSTGLTRAVSFTNYNVGTTYTFSAWIKNIDASVIQFLWYDGSSNRVYKTDEVNTETFTRVSFSFTPTNTNSTLQIQAARDLPTGESFYMYGAQLEEATYPTSYIPTYGVSQTRLAEDMDLNLSTAWDSTGSWTFFFELERMNDDSVDVYNIIRFDGTQGDLLLRDRSTTLQVLVFGIEGISAATTGTISKGDTYKIATKWDGATIKAFFNGSEIVFSNPSSGTSGFNFIEYNTTHIKHKEVYFPTALSDSECIALTTI